MGDLSENSTVNAEWGRPGVHVLLDPVALLAVRRRDCHRSRRPSTVIWRECHIKPRHRRQFAGISGNRNQRIDDIWRISISAAVAALYNLIT